MHSGRAVLAILFLLTLIVGAWILVDEDAARVMGVWRLGELREVADYTHAASRPSELPEALATKLRYYWSVLSNNENLVIYGAISLFGILMVGLAIGNATTTPKDRTTEILELLKQEKEKAENLAKLKSEFLNQVSHELRTPLAVIIGYVECITDGLYGQLEGKHQEILQVVAKQSTHLKNMIDQILIYSRLEASKQPFRIEEFSVNKILGDLRETFDFLCRQKGLELRWELSKDVTTVRSDPERLKEVISNLLQNAVKYTDQGSIAVRLLALKDTDSILLEVVDTGMGIPDHYLSSIFEPFTQAHKTSSENSRGGIGLGLSIVKKHIEQIKGTITVESRLGIGSTFRVTLPRVYEKRPRHHKNLLRLIRVPFSRPKRVKTNLGVAPGGRGQEPRAVSGAHF